jgi:hypothetical protein
MIPAGQSSTPMKMASGKMEPERRAEIRAVRKGMVCSYKETTISENTRRDALGFEGSFLERADVTEYGCYYECGI